jgi:predicted Zn-dependent peptidase
MYGAILDADVTKYADLQMIHLSVQTADDKFSIAGEPLCRESAELLCSVLTDPVLDKYGHFPEQDFRVERNYLIDTIESELNEKRTYAIGKCTEILFRDEPFGVKRYGYKEDAEKLTAEEATTAWRELLKGARMEILFTGPGDPEDAEQVFAERLGGLMREPFGEHPTPPKPYSEYAELDRKDGCRAGEACHGLSSRRARGRDRAGAARMMAALYGGTPFSPSSS